MQLTTSLSRTPTPLLLSRFARLELGGLGRKLARAFGYNRPKFIALEEIRIPDSSLAREATSLVEAVSPLFVLNHSLRTYCFGVALARHLDIKADMEVFYLAAIMHDLGLVAPHDEAEGSFEVVGAKLAHDFLTQKETAREKADLVHEAIALHSSVGIADKLDAEIQLVHYGAGIDVIGFRSEDVSAETREAIVNAYPRHEFKKGFISLLDKQVSTKPQCHIAGHHALGFAGKIQSAPFSE